MRITNGAAKKSGHSWEGELFCCTGDGFAANWICEKKDAR
jgi:hypothetical protein